MGNLLTLTLDVENQPIVTDCLIVTYYLVPVVYNLSTVAILLIAFHYSFTQYLIEIKHKGLAVPFKNCLTINTCRKEKVIVMTFYRVVVIYANNDKADYGVYESREQAWDIAKGLNERLDCAFATVVAQEVEA